MPFDYGEEIRRIREILEHPEQDRPYSDEHLQWLREHGFSEETIRYQEQVAQKDFSSKRFRVQLRPASPSDLEYLKSRSYPESICQFYARGEPSYSVNINLLRLPPVSVLREFNENKNIGKLLCPLGYRIVLPSEDFYCIQIDPDGIQDDSPVFLVDHLVESVENLAREVVEEYSIKIADNYKDFLNKFLRGRLPGQIYDLDWEITSGFFIVKTYEKMFLDYLSERGGITEKIYAIPRKNSSPEDYPLQYRGLDRDALIARDNGDTLAEIRMSEIREAKKISHELIWYWKSPALLSSFEEALEVYEWLEGMKPDYEIVWARIAGSGDPLPEHFISIGFEPSWFPDDFSASNDCMFFAMWHGPDNEGKIFLPYFERMNTYGLFQSVEDAGDFLACYLPFDWTEHGYYVITEVFVQEGSAKPF